MKKHIIIEGKVQNVGYRYWLYKEAIQRNVSGWVKNNASGEVEALVIGNDTDINNLIKLCKKGPPLSKVTKIKVQNYEKEFIKKSFNIISAYFFMFILTREIISNITDAATIDVMLLG